MKEQCVCNKLCFKLGKNVAKTHQILKQAFGDEASGQMQTYDGFNWFENGQTSDDNDERYG